MYLKSIEIRGFKSFADRTLLDFNNGITAVVGPNGSGKSNISDAVRWVLGEQKVKSLRGGKMEDVIFAGTDFRKPLGFAEVTLLLDNSEKRLPIPYQEVSVTRKLFRSGESEYLINNTSCRLKDIHELFMDTGIGKEGYSLIGQGKIEAILSGKMDDRRALLEEAAGIVKYKSRKEESEKKLGNTEQNLLRVQDILKTYDERIGPLKREKEKAEEFLILSKEQRSISISLILSDLEDFEKEQKILVSRRDAAQKEYDQVAQKRLLAGEKLEAIEQSMEEKKARENEQKGLFYEKRDESEAIHRDLALLSQKIEDRQAQILKNEKAQSITEERVTLETQAKEQLALEIKEGQEKIQEIQQLLQGKKDRVKELDNSLKLSENAQKGLRDEEEDAEEKLKFLQEEVQGYYSQRDTLKGKIDHTRSVLDGYQASMTMNLMAKVDTEKEMAALEEKRRVQEQYLVLKSRETQEVQDTIKSIELSMKNMDVELRGQDAQMQLLKNMEHQFEGYTKAVKSLMTFMKNSSHKLKDQVHLVGEVIKPKSGYELALEMALGSQVNHVITPTDQDAKTLIDILRARSFGRATFFPLNVIKGFQAKDPQLKRGKLLGNLLTLVDFEPKYQGIAANLLGRIFVAKNMEEGLVAAKEMGYSHRIVTLEGDIINAGGSLTGGSIYKKSSGIFSRKKDLEDLMASHEALQEKRLEELAEKQSLEKVLQEKSRMEREASFGLNELNLEKTKLAERLEGFKKDVGRLQQVMEQTKRSHEHQKEEMALLVADIEKLDDKIQGFSKQKVKNKDYLKELKEKRTKEFKEFDELNSYIMEESIKEGRLEEALEAKKESFQKQEDMLLELAKQLRSLAEETIQLKEERTLAKETKEALEEKQGMLTKEVAALEKALDEMSMEELKDKVLLKEYAQEERTLDEEFHVLDKDLYKVKDALEKLEKENTALLNKINDELNLTLAEAKEERIPMEDKDLFRKRLNELRRKITQLGHVNVAAIEEYQEVLEHSTFLSTQKEDLEKAKEELKEIIMDMTLRMRTLFTENFKIMNENFNDTFRRLFQGGNAKLLLGEGDILEAPIEISVQPPGKKLQNITLMSGGEKVLSAIALTFAILRMKPTPFCILDEIEAALDDANVYRFAEFLSEFARDTQFILITHRKGTMEAADALYGVTMEEKGISKIVSMDLSMARSENG